MKIYKLNHIDDHLFQSMQDLVAQLSPNAPMPSREDIENIVGAPGCTILVAGSDEEGAQIVGTLTLVIFQVPTGRRARIEDVVVEESVRGQGIGEALVIEALNLVESNGIRSVDLTSNPDRKAANKLYSRLGFILRDTNLFRYEF